MANVMRFTCSACEKGLKASYGKAGRRYKCPACNASIVIPWREPQEIPRVSRVVPIHLPSPASVPAQTPGTVPVEVRLPGQLGGFKANVDQDTANKGFLVALGGALVALGAVAMFILSGGRRAS